MNQIDKVMMQTEKKMQIKMLEGSSGGESLTMGGARNWKEGSLSWREDVLSKGA